MSTNFNGANSNSANLIASSLSTNFNVTPYYDDYDPTKEYYRILFKPGYSVQARELTQLQTMIQSQIKRWCSQKLATNTLFHGDYLSTCAN